MVWNGPLNKIDDFRFEIPSNYKGEKNNLKMKTSAVIYASDNMIKSIRKDFGMGTKIMIPLSMILKKDGLILLRMAGEFIPGPPIGMN